MTIVQDVPQQLHQLLVQKPGAMRRVAERLGISRQRVSYSLRNGEWQRHILIAAIKEVSDVQKDRQLISNKYAKSLKDALQKLEESAASMQLPCDNATQSPP